MILTAQETATIKEMATSTEYRHIATSTLATYAQRAGKVFASASTWIRLVRVHGWRRPRTRVYPAKPKMGIRAKKPNEIWHLDVTVLRLLDGTRLYLHGIVDDFSRRFLAWRLAERLDPLTTCQVLTEAAKNLQGGASPVSVLTDGGVENVNDTVDEFLSNGILRKVLARAGCGEDGSAGQSPGQESRRDLREMHGDVDANDDPRVRSLIEQVNPKTAKLSGVTDYREGLSRMS